MLRRKLGQQAWEWQRGCFDRLWSKWIYVKDNPVRQGLVDNVDDWPYYLDFINEAAREAVSFPYSDRAPIQSVGVGGT